MDKNFKNIIQNKIPSRITLVTLIFLVLLNLITPYIAYQIGLIYLSQEIKYQLESDNLSIEDNIRENSLALKRLGNRWTSINGTGEFVWRSDAKAYSNDLLGVVGTGYADSTSTIKWIEPYDSNKAAIGFRLNTDPRRKSAIIESLETKFPTMTQSVDLKQKGKGYLILYPVYKNQKLDGFVYLVGRFTDYFPNLLRSQDYNYRVYSEKEIIYESEKNIEPDLIKFSQTSNIPIKYTKNWILEIIPKQNKLSKYKNQFILWAIASNILISAIICYILLLYNRSVLLSNQVEIQNNLTNTILDSTDISVISLDLNGQITSLNLAAEKLFGYKESEIIGADSTKIWHDPHELLD
ncbi:CHASE domain-containing protein [Leptospira meyeri]|uniref:CHASE domain-containing protein n=1 Tax=Leptospira meyeri TaxID=29508 RepID=UPI001082FB06|nr:CHASE domain-containing protein [Leptospira meyeri]TGL15014.1 PAS domain S-box protein [Leptospira meyeri]